MEFQESKDFYWVLTSCRISGVILLFCGVITSRSGKSAFYHDFLMLQAHTELWVVAV